MSRIDPAQRILFSAEHLFDINPSRSTRSSSSISTPLHWIIAPEAQADHRFPDQRSCEP